MARWPSFLLTLWLFALFQTAALAYNLPANISNFIPSCATQCFVSFVSVSYSDSGCSHNSLQCLCSQVGATGFTMGEGALQCIVAEKSIGFCSNMDASDDVIYSAYHMCDDEPDAATPTHKVITATLVMPTSGGVITFPPVTTTTTDISEIPTPSLTLSSFSTLPTTLVMETSSSPSIPTTTRSSTRIRTMITSRSTSTSHRTTHSTEPTTSMSSAITLRPVTTSSTDTAQETSATPGAVAGAGKKDGDSLSKNQIAGISVGVLAAAGLAIAAIVLARYYRKKKYPKIKTGFLPNRDTWGYKPTRSNSGGTNSWIAQQARRSLDPFPPPPAPTHARSSHRPGTIGLAISPANSRVTSHTPQSVKSRRMSRLLPAKPVLPVLPLNITKRSSQTQPQDEWPVPNVHYGGPSRQSDPPQLPPLEIAPAASVSSPPSGSKPTPPAPPRLVIPDPNSPPTVAQAQQKPARDSSMTVFEEDERTSLSTTQVWRPPPTTPISAQTFYVADQYGNWKLADPTTAAQLAQAQPPVPKPPPKDDVYTQSSGKGKEKAGSVSPLSDESPKGGLAPPAQLVPGRSQSIQKPMGPRAQPGTALSSLPSQQRNSGSRYSYGRSLTRPRVSGGSDATTITTSSEGTPIDPLPALEQLGSLSPVQESPSSSKGRSPVSYPKIPNRDPKRLTIGGLQDTRIAPPTSKPMAYYPPGQPSPTSAGSTMPPHWAPKSGRRSIANPGLESTGSPTMRIVEPSPEPEDRVAPMPPPKPIAPPFYLAPPYPQPLNPRQSSQHRRVASDSQRQSTQQQPPYPRDSYSQQQYPPQQHPPQQYPQQRYPQQRYPQQQYSQQQYSPQQYPSQQYSQQPYSQQAYSQQPYPPQQYPQQRYSQRQSQQQRQSYRPQQQYPQDQYPHEQDQTQRHSHHAQQHQWHPLHTSQPPRQPLRPHPSSGNAASGSSSLLAKRLGDDRAANMAIPTAASQQKWRRDDASSQQDTRGQGQTRDPAWMPTLTPSRRGDDLFLNVQ